MAVIDRPRPRRWTSSSSRSWSIIIVDLIFLLGSGGLIVFVDFIFLGGGGIVVRGKLSSLSLSLSISLCSGSLLFSLPRSLSLSKRDRKRVERARNPESRQRLRGSNEREERDKYMYIIYVFVRGEASRLSGWLSYLCTQWLINWGKRAIGLKFIPNNNIDTEINVDILNVYWCDHGVSTIVGEDAPTQHGSSSFTNNKIFSFYFLYFWFLIIRIVVEFLVSFLCKFHICVLFFLLDFWFLLRVWLCNSNRSRKV